MNISIKFNVDSRTDERTLEHFFHHLERLAHLQSVEIDLKASHAAMKHVTKSLTTMSKP